MGRAYLRTSYVGYLPYLIVDMQIGSANIGEGSAIDAALAREGRESQLGIPVGGESVCEHLYLLFAVAHRVEAQLCFELRHRAAVGSVTAHVQLVAHNAELAVDHSVLIRTGAVDHTRDRYAEGHAADIAFICSAEIQNIELQLGAEHDLARYRLELGYPGGQPVAEQGVHLVPLAEGDILLNVEAVGAQTAQRGNLHPLAFDL